MVGIQGLGGIPEPKPERPGRVKSERDDAGVSGSNAAGGERQQDDVVISSEARAAAEVARLVQLSKAENEIRLDRVEAARQRIEQGDYKRPEVVAKVAERLLKFLG